MTAKAIGTIDHVVIAVADLDQAAAQYRRLGFTLSPKGVHSAALGSANHTMMLRRDYFELLSVLTPTERNTHWQKKLASGGGVAGIALTTEDAAQAHEIWKAAGFNPDDLIGFSRAVTRQDGVKLEARFEVVGLDEVPGAGVRIFVCSQPTREAVWLPELMAHANTAQAIKRVIIASPDPDATARQWQRVIPGGVRQEMPDGPAIILGAQAIQIISPSTAAQRFGISNASDESSAIGIHYAVADLAAAVAVLKANGIEHDRKGDHVTILPAAACNVRVEFSPAR